MTSKKMLCVTLVAIASVSACGGATAPVMVAAEPSMSIGTLPTTTSSTTSTTLAPTPEEIVNGLLYTYGDPAPATEAYRAVAAARGWSQGQVADWEVFIVETMRRESGFCPNLIGGARIEQTVGCVVDPDDPGHGSDSGFGQVIDIHYLDDGFLCVEEGLCSQEQIIGTPWSSMTALLALIERNGRQPWCYNAQTVSGARCQSAPEHPPAIVA